jgi:hypothetical protein
VLRRLKASRAEIGRAAATVTGPTAPSGVGEVAARRWLSTVGLGTGEDLITLVRLASGREPEWAATVRAVRDRGDPVSRGDLAVSGDDIRQLGADGRRVGEILGALLDRVLDDPSLNTRERLLALARELG